MIYTISIAPAGAGRVLATSSDGRRFTSAIPLLDGARYWQGLGHHRPPASSPSGHPGPVTGRCAPRSATPPSSPSTKRQLDHASGNGRRSVAVRSQTSFRGSPRPRLATTPSQLSQGSLWGPVQQRVPLGNFGESVEECGHAWQVFDDPLSMGGGPGGRVPSLETKENISKT